MLFPDFVSKQQQQQQQVFCHLLRFILAPVMFYSSNGVILLFFLMLARNWPEFMFFWDQTESLMDCQGCNKTKLRATYNVITIGVLLMAAG